MKGEVYSWRLTGELKSDLEREARLRRMPVAAVLEAAVRDWLKNGDTEFSDDGQLRLHAAAADCFGIVDSGNPRRSETTRAVLRERLKRRHAR